LKSISSKTEANLYSSKGRKNFLDALENFKDFYHFFLRFLPFFNTFDKREKSGSNYLIYEKTRPQFYLKQERKIEDRLLELSKNKGKFSSSNSTSITLKREGNFELLISSTISKYLRKENNQ
jgi:hypothetical protein